LGRTVVTILLIAAGFAILYLVLKKKIEARTDSSVVLGQIRDEVDRIILELNQTTERNISLIEDKLAALSDLLGQADKRIALLRRESEKNAASSQVYTNILQHRAGEEPESPEDPHGEVLRLLNSGVSPAAIAKRLGKPLAEVDLIISLSARRR
jgi:hypothetical protein